MGGGDRRPGCQQVLRHRVDLLSLLLFLLLSFCIGDPEASWSSSLLPRGQQITNFQTQQGLLPFPEGKKTPRSVSTLSPVSVRRQRGATDGIEVKYRQINKVDEGFLTAVT